jgi:hypothetical protein
MSENKNSHTITFGLKYLFFGDTLSLVLDDGRFKSGKLFFKDDYINEDSYKINQEPLFYKQNIQTIYRNYFEKKSILKVN